MGADQHRVGAVRVLCCSSAESVAMFHRRQDRRSAQGVRSGDGQSLGLTIEHVPLKGVMARSNPCSRGPRAAYRCFLAERAERLFAGPVWRTPREVQVRGSWPDGLEGTAKLLLPGPESGCSTRTEARARPPSTAGQRHRRGRYSFVGRGPPGQSGRLQNGYTGRQREDSRPV